MGKKLFRITTVPASLGGLLHGQLRFMSSRYEVTGISSSGRNGHLDQVAKTEQIRVMSVEMTRKITPFKDLKAVWHLYTIFRKERPFIVHTHTPKAGTLGMLAAYLSGVPHRLHTIAGLPLLEARGPKRWMLDQVEKITYRFATKVYPNSFGLRDIVIENGYTTPSKLKVLGNGSSNGINTSHFDPALFAPDQKSRLRASLGIGETDFVFLFVGRLVRDKGVNELIRAFDTIGQSRKNIKLILVGSFEKDLDPLDEETRTTIDSNEHVKAVGWQDDVRPFFAISDVLVFPSYREGFPNVVMQAGAMGLPCIVTDINGCNEIIIPGENGVIIPPKDTGRLIEEMTSVLADGKDRFKPELCRKLVVDRYDQQFIWDAILAEYQKLEPEAKEKPIKNS